MSAVSAEPPNMRRSDVGHHMPGRALRCGYPARGVQFGAVPLAVAEAQRVREVAVRAGYGQHGRGVEAAAEQDHCGLVHAAASLVATGARLRSTGQPFTSKRVDHPAPHSAHS